VTEFVHPAGEYEIVEAEPPELLARNLSSASHLLSSATAFFFLAFVFAYFYLRAQNNAGLWHPKHVAPSQTLGALILAATLASALLVRLGLLDRRAERRAPWRLKGTLALALGVAAVVLQVVEWTTVGFGPADGGYASVFVGWTAFWVLFALGGLFWLETLLANAFRYRNVPLHEAPAPGEASGDPHRTGHDIAEALQLVLPGLEAFSFFWTFLAGIELLAWILLYVA
jgi:heme/copper-type cytochrome/quinol oxidase subunit 3